MREDRGRVGIFTSTTRPALSGLTRGRKESRCTTPASRPVHKLLTSCSRSPDT